MGNEGLGRELCVAGFSPAVALIIGIKAKSTLESAVILGPPVLSGY
jgi:hypothetical protein